MIQAIPQYLPQAVNAPQPNYNAVKIDVHNPSVAAPNVGVSAPGMGYPQYNPQYAAPTAPYYNYPQAQLYDYPQAPVYQPAPYQVPYAQPQYQTPYPQAAAYATAAAQQAGQPQYQPQAAAIAQAPVVPAPQVSAVQAPPPQLINQQNINVPPQPVITQPGVQQAAVQPVEIVPPEPMTPQIDVNAFIAKLTNEDYEVQANGMEKIANMVKDEPQKATELLDEQIVNALTGIIKKDTSKLAGPGKEQIAARQKLMTGKKISDKEKELAMTITPMEQAERNKSYAMFTLAIMQKLYGDEVAKLTNQTVPLTELPGMVTIVEQLKDNPNPMARVSALESLNYIQQPAYKQELETLFKIAQNDADPNVKEAAKAAQTKLNELK
jgi:hypothetical protein